MWRERGSERGRVFELKLLKLLLRLLQCRSESTRLLYPCRVVGRVHRRYFLRRRSSRLRRRRKRRREWGVWEGGRELRLQSRRRRRRRRSRRRRLVSCEPSCVWAFQRLLVEPLREENVGGRDARRKVDPAQSPTLSSLAEMAEERSEEDSKGENVAKRITIRFLQSRERNPQREV